MKNRWMISTALVGMLVLPTLAQAQTTRVADSTGAQPEATDANPTQEGLQDIIVTAQRRSENLQRAAIAVTAVTGESLVQAGVTSAQQLTNVAPSLQVSTFTGPSTAFYLRGVGNFTTNSLSDSAVAVSIDGVYLGRPSSVAGLFYDLDRIEVLKGPQGTLYGRNATGGAINIISTKPILGEFSGYGSFEYGNFDAKQFTGAINISTGSNSAVRIAGQIVDRDGYYTDGTGDAKSESIRGQFVSHLAPGLKVTVGADFSHQGGIGTGATLNQLNKDDRIGLYDPRAGAVYAASFVFPSGSNLYPLVNVAYNNNKFWGVYAQAEIDTPIGTLTILPAYRRSELNFRNAAGSFDIIDRERANQTSVEARLASNGDGPFSYIVGGYFMNENVVTQVVYNQQYLAPYSRFEPKTNSYAAFGRLNYALTDSLRISGGIRYTIDQKSAKLSSDTAFVLCPGAFIPPPGGPQFCFGTPALPSTLVTPGFLLAPDGNVIPVQPYGTSGAIVQTSRNVITPSKTFRKPTYRVGVEYDVGASSLLYATFETGFKSGGFFSSIDDPSYDPETITSYTIGSKNRFLDNRLQINIEAFRWTYKNQQVSHFGSNTMGGTEFVTENIGKTRIQGVEVEGQFRIFHNTTLNGTVQYLDAKNQEFIFASAAAVGAPLTGCGVTGPVAGFFQVNCSGRRPTQAPEWTLTGGFEQVIPLGDLGSLTFNARTRYQSEMNTGFDLLAAQVQKGYFMSDLQLTYTAPNDRFTIAGFVNNVEDNTVVAFSQPEPRSKAFLVQNLRAPRTYGVRVGAKF